MTKCSQGSPDARSSRPPTSFLLPPASTSAQTEHQEEGLQDTGVGVGGWGVLRNTETVLHSPGMHQCPPPPIKHRNMAQWGCDPEEALWQEQRRNSRWEGAQGTTAVPKWCWRTHPNALRMSQCSVSVPHLVLTLCKEETTQIYWDEASPPDTKSKVSLFTENKSMLCLLHVWVGRLR